MNKRFKYGNWQNNETIRECANFTLKLNQIIKQLKVYSKESAISCIFTAEYVQHDKKLI